MSDFIIHESQEGGRYEAWALVDGVRFDVVRWRDPAGNWPFDMNSIAHAEIKAAVYAYQAKRKGAA